MFGSHRRKEEILIQDFVRVREEEGVILQVVAVVAAEHAAVKEVEAVTVTQVVRVGAEAAPAVEANTAAAEESGGRLINSKQFAKGNKE